jgi:hypothetical protein
MALNFPNSPVFGQQHADEGQVWTWDGIAWTVSSSGILLSYETIYPIGAIVTSTQNVNPGTYWSPTTWVSTVQFRTGEFRWIRTT